MRIQYVEKEHVYKLDDWNIIEEKFVPENNNTTVVEKKEKKQESHIMEDATYENISKEEAKVLYDKAYYMSEYLKVKEYVFRNDAINPAFKSIWTYNEENFPIWYVLNVEYNKDIVIKSLPNNAMVEKKININNGTYKVTNNYFTAANLEEEYYKYFLSDYNYERQDQIGYGGCYVAVYNADLDGYVVYQNTKSCEGGLYKVNYKLIHAEKIEDFIYLYEKNVTTNEEFMYTIQNENDIYKFVSRIKNIEKEAN